MISPKNINITVNTPEIREHSKASEKYVDVTFKFDAVSDFPYKKWNAWIPIEYRRTGISINNDKEISEYLNKVYDYLNMHSYIEWRKNAIKYWQTEKRRSKTTFSFFELLSDPKWHCVKSDLPANPNFARRIQAIKECGYTVATDTHRYCKDCKEFTTQILLIPIARGNNDNGYELISSVLKKRILKTLGFKDAYEDQKSSSLLPDHKFPEIRWDSNTKSVNLDDMTETQIKDKFQLLTNQRNLQKREKCRQCFQTGKRQCPFGIKYFYKGDENWDPQIETHGKNAERGCEGCGWYDLEKWRSELNKKLKK
jgi:hypothetical protein